jgi:glycyl-tRNA synthetase beta chain
MPDFLFELGLEEIPARMIESAEAELRRRVVDLLLREHLLDSAAKNSSALPPVFAVTSYSTPRRLAVLIRGVDKQQPDITEETTGPAVKIAFRDGVPTPAAEAFARKSGVAVTDLRTITTPKGDYLAATSVKKGRSAADVIAAELPREIAAIYWAKNMYWRAGKPEKFVRPVLWMVCLLGDTIVPVEFAGKTADRVSYGHRVLSSGEAFDIVVPESYLVQLEGEYVLADVEVRRQKIRKALDKVTREIPSARWREDEALVDGVTHLTEWPDVLLGSFEQDYLALPEEVLVTVMRDHQKYFAVEDATGKLAPHFLTVTNIALDEANAPIIKQGNERVLRARFNDAKFFWEFDQKISLIDRVPMLEKVMFQKDLGTYAAKSDRVRALASKLAQIANSRGAAVDGAAVDEAARLAKTDLTTELVKEFTELQGQIGGLYAKSQGISAKVADAIYDQYLPATAGDAIPRSPEGAILGLADRIDTIAGMFSLGMEPTGSKDPFALRRAANSVVRILAESGLPLLLSDMLTVIEVKTEVATRLGSFFAERIEFYLREGCNQAYDVVKAIVAVGANDVAEAVARAKAVTTVRGSENFLAVSAAFKRMKNILAQSEDTEDLQNALDGGGGAVEPAQAALLSAAEDVEALVKVLAAKHQYAAALEAIATLRPYVDTFFDQVMVLDPNPAKRRTNLAVLAAIVSNIRQIVDLSEIVTAG